MVSQEIVVVASKSHFEELFAEGDNDLYFRVVWLDDVGQALDYISSLPHKISLLVVDLQLDALELVSKLHGAGIFCPWVAVSSDPNPRFGAAAMRHGADDFLLLPLDSREEVMDVISKYVREPTSGSRIKSAKRIPRSTGATLMVGSSPVMSHLRAMVAAVAPTMSTVLITGATGTGKELVARSIHMQSQRAGEAFVPLNCGELSSAVLESELFGHARGAFTGAASARSGLFVSADQGTLFLDEVGELPLPMQTRLLRVLQDAEVRPVGSDSRRKVDVRILAATNRSLKSMVSAGEFREDLFFRLKVFDIRVPKLEERKADIPELTLHLVERVCRNMGRFVPMVSPEVFEQLAQQLWPGNVRQLENTIERALVLCGDTLLETHFQLAPASILPSSSINSSVAPLIPYREAKIEFEQTYLRSLLQAAGGSRSEAARLAHLDPSNLRRMLRKYGIS